MNLPSACSIQLVSRFLRRRTAGIVAARVSNSAQGEELPFRNHSFSSQRNRKRRTYQSNVLSFLKKVENEGINTAIVTQRVEELFLELLKAENNPEDGQLALDLLNKALEHKTQNERIVPRLFSLACQVMVRSGHPLALKEVRRQVFRLLDGNENFLTNDIPYNTHHVNDACCQFINLALEGKKGRLDYATNQEVMRLIKCMKKLYKDPSVPLVASPDSVNAFIMYYCKSEKPKKAYSELKSMLNEPNKFEPRLSSFSLIISAFGLSSEPEKSMEIIQWMLSSYKLEDSMIPPPNRACFNGVLHAWARSGRKNAGQRAEEILEWMRQLHGTETLETEPDEISFASCINAWARSPASDAPIRAESLLHQMTLASHDDGKTVTPTMSAFSSVMDAWARSGRDDAPVKVESILKRIEDTSDNTDDFELTAFPYTILIKTWGNAARRRTGRKKSECGDRILQVLSRMQNKGIDPPAATQNAAMTAFLEISATNAALYFLYLEGLFQKGLVQLDTRTFNCGLNAIASMNKPDAAAKAMEVLHRMSNYSEKDASVLPDELTFNIILKVLSRSHAADAAEKAEKLLQKMHEMSSVSPTFISYLTCIIAWGRSDDKDKFQRAKNLLDQFESAYRNRKLAGKLSVAVYNAVLSVCYHNEADALRDEVLQVAVFTMEKLRAIKVPPDATTYDSLFRIICSLPQEHTMKKGLMNSEFSNCINDGLVTSEILAMVEASSPEILQESDGHPIPAKWSRKVNRR